MYNYVTLSVLTCLLAVRAYAGDTEVINVDVRKLDTEHFHFSVTLKHADTGWDHYANKWEIVGKEGEIYGTRILHHPHVNEQPFTRSLSSVYIPKNIEYVIIRGFDSVHGDGTAVRIKLPK